MLQEDNNVWRRNLVMLWISQLLIMVGFEAMTPFVPLYIKNGMGITDPEEVLYGVALYNFCGTIAYMIFVPLWGWLSDRVGVKPMLIRGTFVTAFIFPLMAFTKNVEVLAVLRFLSAAMAGTTAASNIMILRYTPTQRQGFALGSLTTTFWGGTMLGQVTGGFMINAYGFKSVFLLCGILYLIAGFAVLFTRDNFTYVPKPKKVFQWKNCVPKFTTAIWWLLLVFLFFGLIRAMDFPFTALKIESITGTESAAYWTGIVGVFLSVGAICSGIAYGWLCDRFSPGKLLIPTLLISAIMLAMQGYTDNLVVFTASRALLYATAGGLGPILQKTLASATPRRKRGSVFGTSQLFQCLGGAAAAWIGKSVVSGFGLPSVYYGAAIGFALAIPLFLRVVRYVVSRPFYFGIRDKQEKVDQDVSEEKI